VQYLGFRRRKKEKIMTKLKSDQNRREIKEKAGCEKKKKTSQF